MYETTKQGLEEAQERAVQATKQLSETSRSAFRNYLKSAFQFQRAGLEAVEALQTGLEELTFEFVDRTEAAQEKVLKEAESRLRDGAERLREAREKSVEALHENNEKLQEAREKSVGNLRENVERLQGRLTEGRDEMEETSDKTESRFRDGAEIASKVMKVIETRIETALTELLEMGRRELNEVEERIEALVDRLDAELDNEIHPIAEYDEKTVEEVNAALSGLDPVQLRIVRAYEVNRKNRVTILRTIDEKLAEADEGRGKRKSLTETVIETVQSVVEGTLPIEQYNEKNVDEVVSALSNLPNEALQQVREYEVAHKNRVTVLRAIDEKLALQPA